MLILIRIAGLALAVAGELLRRRGGERASLALWALACGCPLALAWWGMDFSPSFTMMFLVADLMLCTLAEVLARCLKLRDGAEGAQGVQPTGSPSSAHTRLRDGANRVAAALEGLLFGAGTVFALPSVFIYAAGDDWIQGCTVAALAAGTLLAGAHALRSRGAAKRPSLAELALTWFSLCASCFALACGLRSPMLLFYGAGRLLFTAARMLGQDANARPTLFWFGLAVACAFPIGPML